MRRVLIFMFCQLVVCSCIEQTVTSSQSTYKTVINKTNKKLFYEVQTDLGIKNTIVEKYDSSIISFFKTNEKTKIFLGGTARLDQISILKELIYNLTDTTLFEYNLEYSFVSQVGQTKEEKIFGRHLFNELGEKSTDINSVLFIKLVVDDSIINIMHKDDTMLDKFKEYYKK